MADNRGAQALRKWLETSSQVALAAETKISQSFISRLASAEKTPKLLEDGLALQRVAGIDPDWWKQKPVPERKKAS